MEAERYRELLEWLEDRKPSPDIASDVLSMADHVAEEIRAYGRASSILKNWGESGEIPEVRRNTFLDRATYWDRMDTQLHNRRIHVKEDSVTVSDSRNLPIDQILVSNHPAIVFYTNEGEENRNLQFHTTSHPVSFSRSPEHLFNSPVTPDPLMGVPLHLEGGPWRYSLTLTFDSLQSLGSFQFGLFPVSDLTSGKGSLRYPAHFRVRMPSANQIARSVINNYRWTHSHENNPEIQHLIGEPLRIEVEFMPGRNQLRFMILETEEETLLYHDLYQVKPLPAGPYIMGFRSIQFLPGHSRVTLHAARFFGRARLLEDDHRFLSGLFQKYPALKYLTGMTRRKLGGRGLAGP